MKKFIIYISIFIAVLSFAGCTDELLYDNSPIGEGEGGLQATVSFFPVVESLGTRGTAGDAIEEIKDLSIIIYDQYKNLYKVYNSTDGDFTFTPEEDHNNKPEMSDEDKTNGGVWSEQSQAKVSFSLSEIPYGRYYIYCVANMGGITDEQAETIEKLQNLQLTWNPTDISANNQMYGYFTTQEAAATDKPIAGFDANQIVVNNKVKPIHAWIKRAASKVTVEYDGSGLNQDVFIYIKSVTIKDIPRYCLLGADNTPVEGKEGEESPLITDGETIYYDINGIMDGEQTDPDFQKWMTITNLDKTKWGSHAYNAQSLFFYENMQGDKKDLPDKDDYNKQPNYKDVEDFINNIKPNETPDPSKYDTKDKVPMGTYIEVEGYYLSQNKANLGSGPIKYRFMLGKNTTYNYNAQRNHHYKVTLKFHGWANQPEWHIDYVQENPGVYVPDRFYMPYIYNQKADFPIKLNGNCTSLKVEIVQNDWAPHLPDNPIQVPDGTINATVAPAYGMASDYYNFIWNTTTWEIYNGMTKGWQCLGFLALAKPSDTPPANILMNKDYSDGLDGYNDLKDYYEGKGTSTTPTNNIPQNVREFTNFSGTGNFNTDNSHGVTINEYTITRKDNDGCDLLIPLFTRPKSMIHNTDYSGNNPYGYFVRYAKLKITATFDTPNGSKTDEKEVDIIQVPRITNPKAVWRKGGSTEAFNVELMTRSAAPGNSPYLAFVSDGSWTAEVDQVGQSGNFTIEETDGDYMPGSTTTRIEGRTGSYIKFKIKFGGAANACGIVNVRYNGGTCIHKIFLRQGYEPMQVTDNGATWCTYNVYKAQDSKATFNGDVLNINTISSGDEVVTATLVQSPLSIGTLFKKGNYNQGILISNNDTWGSIVNPGNLKLSNGQTLGWGSIRSVNNTSPSSFTNPQQYDNQSWQWAKFQVGDKRYRVPTYAEFQDLTNNCEFGFGVLYGDGATSTQSDFVAAEGFSDPTGDNTSSESGVRGVIVYNRSDARQIFFTMGKFGQGRRTVYNLQGSSAGILRYGDVSNPLALGTSPSYNTNIFRPIPYNLGHQPGSLYWTRQYYQDATMKNPSGAWDINYFSFNFQSYTDNNWKDAIPIKLVVDQ